jgi:hypothetical protein
VQQPHTAHSLEMHLFFIPSPINCSGAKGIAEQLALSHSSLVIGAAPVADGLEATLAAHVAFSRSLVERMALAVHARGL